MSNLPTIAVLKTDSTTKCFLWVLREFLKVVESLFSNRNFGTLIPCRELYHVDWLVLNIGRLPFNQSSRVTANCSAAKIELLSNFLKGVLGISENF